GVQARQRVQLTRTNCPFGFTKTSFFVTALRRPHSYTRFLSPVAIVRRPYPIPFRTRKSSSFTPMVLQGSPCGRVGHRRHPLEAPRSSAVKRSRGVSSLWGGEGWGRRFSRWDHSWPGA